MKRVLITGARAPVALDLARAFRNAGCDAALADSVWPYAARLSRPRFPIHSLSPPRFAFEAFRTALRALVVDVDLIVPTCEEVFWLAAAAERDGWSNKLFAPDFASLRKLHSKASFPELAKAAGVDAPTTTAIASREELEPFTASASQLVFKPEFSRFGSRTLVAPDSVTVRKLTPTPEHRWVAQERIGGEEFCVWCVVRDGALTACVIYRPLLRHGRSASYAFEAVDQPAVTIMAEKITRAVGGSGQLSYDVIVTPSGRVAPLECNPRTVSGVHLLDVSPAIARAIIDGVKLSSPPQGTTRYLLPAMVLMGVPTTIAGGSWTRFRQVWRNGQDAIVRDGDRMPAAGVLLDAARFALLGLTRLNSPSGESTDDIEWNGEPIP